MTPEERIEDIERLVIASSAGPNDSALRVVREHVFALLGQIKDAHGREKLASIESWADIYFSHRKHEKYSGGGRQVASSILADCQGVKDAL